MGAVIRQQFIHPISEARYVREMHVDVEIVRPDGSENMASEIYLRVDPWGQHIPSDQQFSTVLVDPRELIADAIDGKRTTSPVYCARSYLIEKAAAGSHRVHVFDNGAKGLNAKIGDPIVFLSDLGGTRKTYAIVSAIEENNWIHIATPDGLPEDFMMGAFVQNLADRWHRKTPLGAKSQIKRPSQVAGYAEKHDGDDWGIDLIISEPMNPGIIKCFDIYVRDRYFSEIEAHWMPDLSDMPLLSDMDRFTAKTCNGGPDAGGRYLKEGRYYIAIISKDRPGRSDVNESSFMLLTFELN